MSAQIRIFTFMKTLLMILGLTCVVSMAWGQQRTSQVLDTGWKFHKGAVQGAQEDSFDDSGWNEVRVPHDWAIAGPFIEDGDGNTGKLPWRDEGWYRLGLGTLDVYEGRTVYLIFDGVMAFPRVYLNGELVGKWDYGYNSFYLDITNAIDFEGNNVLAVHANTKDHDSRWYPGGGIYRKVTLMAVDPVHVDVWGTYVTTPIIKPHYADVRVETNVVNSNKEDTELSVVQKVVNQAGGVITSDTTDLAIKSKSSATCESNMTIGNPHRWDIDEPYLYTLTTEVWQGDDLRDTYNTKFGVRTIRFTADNGFYLNGRRVQLKGANLHHDLGPLGAAFNKRAMERQLEIMMDMGVNSVRTSHNIAAPEVLELCDEMGLLVFDEILDKYDGKADITDTTDFNDFTHRNMRNFVRRDRNHPSVFLWSVGNEIRNVQWNLDGGFQKLRTMISYLEMYDQTRPNTLVCDSKEGAINRHFDYYDVHSWNYGRRYELARQLEPNKAVIISESASTLSTRGFYEFPLPKEKTDFTKSLQVSSYDLNAPWWAEVADDDFMWQQEEEYVAGEYIWTGFDYLGEPTPYNNGWSTENGMTDRQASRSSYFGVVDLCGIPKDRFYLYKSYWKPEETTVHILPHWNWEDRVGDTTPVFVYTNGDCAELFLNGESQGKLCKKPKSRNSIERFRLMWNDILYKQGELIAVAYREGEEIGRDTVRTAGAPSKLKLTPDRNTIRTGGDDLAFVLLEALDSDGNLSPLAMDELAITVEGAGELAGAGNGNPQSFDAFQDNDVSLFYGKAMVILRSSDESGELVLKITGSRFEDEAVTIDVEKE